MWVLVDAGPNRALLTGKMKRRLGTGTFRTFMANPFCAARTGRCPPPPAFIPNSTSYAETTKDTSCHSNYYQMTVLKTAFTCGNMNV